MSYCSENALPIGTPIKDVRELISLLGYQKTGTSSDSEYGRFEDYWFFDETDYKSWSGVGLPISPQADRSIIVSTRSPMGRSYYDLALQNKTISLIRRRFGGTFITDEGTGRYLRPRNPAPPPAASGSFLAFSRFNSNLTTAMRYVEPAHFRRSHGIRIPSLSLCLSTIRALSQITCLYRSLSLRWKTISNLPL